MTVAFYYILLIQNATIIISTEITEIRVHNKSQEAERASDKNVLILQTTN
jgi:hypothetical protein